VRDIHRDTHVSEMKAITAPNQRQRNDMMQHQLLKVLARLLEHEDQHQSLLRPVARLEEVVRLEDRLVTPVGKTLEHARGAKVPHGAPTHDINPQRPEDAKIDGRVELLHEPRLLGPTLDPQPHRDRPDHALHQELAREREDDRVEEDKCKIAAAFAVLDRGIGRDVCGSR